MLVEYFIIFVCILFGLLVAAIIVTLAQQFKTNKYFKKISPRLPVPYELMSLFGGHAKAIQISPRSHYVIDGLHEKYGKTFGHYYCNSPWVSTMDVDLIKEIAFDDSYLNQNRSDFRMPFCKSHWNHLGFTEDEHWKRLRKVYGGAFAKYKIQNSENVRANMENILNMVNELFDRKLEEANKGKGEGVMIDITDLTSRLSVDMVFKTFHKQDGLVDYNSKEDYYTSITERIYRKSTESSLIIVPVLFPTLIGLIEWYVMNLDRCGSLRLKILNFIRDQTKQNLDAKREVDGARKQAEVAGLAFDKNNFNLNDGSTFERNLIDSVIDSYFSKKIKKGELMNTTMFLFFAAQKTTGEAILMLLYNLACNQEVQDKLRDSIKTDGEDSEYLDWCIQESIRLFPPATLGCSRTIEKDYFTKDGILIPKGTFVLTSTYSIHRSVEYWGEDANEFKPDRWSNSKNFHPAQFLSFGVGSRNCLGKHFAMYSIKKLFCSIISKYKFSITPETSRNTQFKSMLYLLTIFDDNYSVKLTKIEE